MHSLSGGRSAGRVEGILCVSFNQDNTCLALGTTSGVQIYNLAAHKCIYTYNIGAIRSVQMLFCTSLVAYVGAGLQPALTPRKLTLLNTAASNTIQDLSFPSVVLSVLINKARLVAVLEQQVSVYALQSLALLFSIDTPNNLKGLAALASCDQPCLLAVPASGPTSAGTLRIYNLLSGSESAGTDASGRLPGGVLTPAPPSSHGDGGAAVLCELVAHQAPLAAMAWYCDGSLLATASTKGTVIRVHRLPTGVCVGAFRRGTVPATIHTLAWSPPHVQPPLLAVSSSRGSVHLFRLDEEPTPGSSPSLGLKAAGGATGVAAGLLSVVMRLAPGNTLMGPHPSITSMRLPVEGTPAAVGLLPRRQQQPCQGQGEGQGREGEGDPVYDADAVTLVVAAADGLLYEYAVNRLHSTSRAASDGPTCSLEGEWALLGTGHAGVEGGT